MKTIMITLLMGAFMLFSPAMNAQKAGKAAKAHRHAAHKSKAKRYHRSKVIVVRKRKGRVIGALPNGHLKYVHNGKNLFYHNGWFYRADGTNYRVASSPYGLKVKTLAKHHKKIMVAGKPYFYANGVYYLANEGGFVVTEPVIGAIVDELPEDEVEEITINDESFFEYDNYLYKAVSENNVQQYEVVGKLEE